MLGHLGMETTTNGNSEADSKEDEEVLRILGKLPKKNSKKINI